MKYKISAVLVASIVLLTLFGGKESNAALQTPPCDTPGWFPTGFGLKDHTVFWYNGFYYIASNHIDTNYVGSLGFGGKSPDFGVWGGRTHPPHSKIQGSPRQFPMNHYVILDVMLREKDFAYARSSDLCDWEELPPILTERTPGDWDESAIWAPLVLEENGIYYMYYTGVTGDITQSIMLATSTDPADPNAWQEYGMIFQPNHPGMVWAPGQWADNRDPHVIRVGSTYYLYYTGTDVSGGIIGWATAASPFGPWTDHGSVITPIPGRILESAAIFYQHSLFYLVYHQTQPGLSEGAFFVTSPNPTGPWSAAYPLKPGWAHEFWFDVLGDLYTSYLTGYTVTISPISWNFIHTPPYPFIGAQIYQQFFPIMFQGNRSPPYE